MRKSGKLVEKAVPESTKNSTCFVSCFVLFRGCFRCERKYLKDNKENKLLLASEICTNSCPWTLSVPRSSQLPSSFALGQLFASRSRQYPRTTIRAYFLAQSSLLFIYYSCERIDWKRSQCRKAQAWNLSNLAFVLFRLALV